MLPKQILREENDFHREHVAIKKQGITGGALSIAMP